MRTNLAKLVYLLIAVILLTHISPTAAPRAAIIQQKSLSKAEVLARLDAASRREIVQGDIASEISERGIDFQLTEAIINELRKAGAKTIVIDAMLRANSDKAAAAKANNGNPSSTSANNPDDDNSVDNRSIENLPFIEQARYNALTYSQELPNFIVSQRIYRYTRDVNTGQWRARDTLDLEVTYEARNGEKYFLKAINGTPTKLTYDKVGGASSAGEFGTLLVALFNPQEGAKFTKGPADKIDGHKTIIYDFKVPTATSSNRITESRSNQTITSGYKGSVWIDEATKRILRIESSADDIPRNFPITVAESAVDYSWFNINGEQFLLPKRAELIIGSDREAYYSRNVIEFSNYRKFDTDVRLGGVEEDK